MRARLNNSSIQFLVCLGVCFSYFSCNNLLSDKGHELKLDTLRLSDGSFFIGHVNQDSLKRFGFTFYRSDDSTIVSSNFIYEAPGTVIHCDSNGRIIYRGHMKNGLEDSLQLDYYENGKVKQEYYADSGKQMGGRIKYYENGQRMEYAFLDELSRVRFRNSYDQNGILISSMGTPLVHVNVIYESPLRVDTTYQLEVVFAAPPGNHVELHFSEESNLISEMVIPLGEYCNVTYFSFTPIKAGTYHTKVTMRLTDSVTNKSEEFSIPGSFIVTE